VGPYGIFDLAILGIGQWRRVATLYDAAGVARSLVVSSSTNNPGDPLNNKGTPTVSRVQTSLRLTGPSQFQESTKTERALMAARNSSCH